MNEEVLTAENERITNILDIIYDLEDEMFKSCPVCKAAGYDPEKYNDMSRFCIEHCPAQKRCERFIVYRDELHNVLEKVGDGLLRLRNEVMDELYSEGEENEDVAYKI